MLADFAAARSALGDTGGGPAPGHYKVAARIQHPITPIPWQHPTTGGAPLFFFLGVRPIKLKDAVLKTDLST